jgi:protocatechuate 3,4-dioxygenase alpha subunit
MELLMADDLRIITPSQTVGPFFSFCLTRHPAHLSLLGDHRLATAKTSGHRIAIEGTMYDGEGKVVPDALIEVWQANQDGVYADLRSQHAGASFTGFGRVELDDAGRFAIDTIKPGSVPAPDGSSQAPHLALGIFAKGLNRRLYTRLYFDDETLNASDYVLKSIPAARRNSLVASKKGDSTYSCTIRLQGADETVFLEA